MRHGIVMDGSAYRLRPVRIDDAAFIHNLRHDPRRSRYINRGAEDIAGQRSWIEAYLDRAGDYYFVIEARSSGRSEGAAGIYHVDPLRRSAEWGRWIVRPGSFAAVESACLIYRVAFELLGLDSLYCRTIAENSSALAFHDSFGLERRQILPRYIEVNGCWLDAVESRLTRARWNELRKEAESKAERVAAWSTA